MIVLYFNNDIHDLLMIFMGMWVIVNWWLRPVPDFHFRKLEAMHVQTIFRRHYDVKGGGGGGVGGSL